MSKLFVTGAAVLLTSLGSAAFAQGYPSTATTETTTSTTAVDPYVTSKTQKVTEHTVDADGTEITKTKTYESGNGTLSGDTKLQVKSPDGLSRTVEHHEITTGAPVPLTSTSRESTTTTTTDH